MSHTMLKYFTVILLFLSSCTDLGEPTEPIRSIRVNPGLIDFGSVTVGSFRTDSISVVSDGTDEVTVSLTLSSSNSSVFSITGSTGFSISSGDSVSVFVSYTPTSNTTDLDSLIVSNEDDPDQIVFIPLSGTGSELPISNLEVSSSTIDFGTVVVGDSTDATLTVANSGDTTLVIFEISLYGDDVSDFQIFTQIDTLELAPDSNTALVLQFKPTSEEEKSASLEIESNDPDSPMSVSLTGTGVTTVTFNSDVGPIIGPPGGFAGCQSSCHTFVTSSGWTYAAIVNVASSQGTNYITPGDTTQSYLFLKIKGTAPSGGRMPQDDPSYFDDNPDQLNIIREWIIQGAIE